jgi:predicted DNA-binding ribbon-helix-helix protein
MVSFGPNTGQTLSTYFALSVTDSSTSYINRNTKRNRHQISDITSSIKVCCVRYLR